MGSLRAAAAPCCLHVRHTVAQPNLRWTAQSARPCVASLHRSCWSRHFVTVHRSEWKTQCKSSAAAEPDFDVQLLDPVPITDKNIDASEFDDGVVVDDESTTRRGDELDREILIKRGAGGELDLRDVTILNHEDDTHTTPSYTGIIPQTPAQYQAIPVETVLSGDMLDNVPEKQILRQLLLIKVAAEEPEHELDFDNAFCFDCGRQELYKVAYVSVQEPAEISDPVLRPEHDMFILDSRETMPTPMMVNLKHEANEIGAEFDVDLFSGLPPPATAIAALPAGDDSDGDSDDEVAAGGAGGPSPPVKAAEVSAAEVVQALVAPGEGEGAGGDSAEGAAGAQTTWEAAAADEESATEEVDSLGGGVETDRNETPDVPAVDLA